jgi:Domain of unknown function (DUF1707)
MDRGGWHYPPGDVRVSDADRDQALSELSQAFQAGRLTSDELEERSAQALATRTGEELTGLLADLPVDRAPVPQTTVVDRAHLALAAGVAAAAAVLAWCFTALATAGAVLSLEGPTLQERAFAASVAARLGKPPPVFPPSPGFDWASVTAPATVAVLLTVLAICLRIRLAREVGGPGHVRR